MFRTIRHRILCIVLILFLLTLTACARPLSSDDISATRDRAMRRTMGFDCYLDTAGTLHINPDVLAQYADEYKSLDGSTDIRAFAAVNNVGTIFLHQDGSLTIPIYQQDDVDHVRAQESVRDLLQSAWSQFTFRYIGESSDINAPWLITDDGRQFSGRDLEWNQRVDYANNSAAIRPDGVVMVRAHLTDYLAFPQSTGWDGTTIQIANLPNCGTLIGLTADRKLVQCIYNEQVYQDVQSHNPIVNHLDEPATELIYDTAGSVVIARRPNGTLFVAFAANPDVVPLFDENKAYDQLIYARSTQTTDGEISVADTGFWLAVTPDGTVEYLPTASASESDIAADKAAYAWILSRTDVRRLHSNS